MKPEMLLEIFRQTAFISAVVGGFIFGFIAVFLTASSRKRIVGWTAVLAIASAVGFLICVLGWTMSIPRLQILVSAPQNENLNPLFSPLMGLHRPGFVSANFKNIRPLNVTAGADHSVFEMS
jgi:hypothetical protein